MQQNRTADTPIFKTLVLKGDKSNLVVALIPLDTRLDYKKMAKETGNRKIGLPPIEYVTSRTGYPHGANTPIGIYLHLPQTVITADTIINNYNKIIVSSGELGRGIIISVKDLSSIVNLKIIDILK